MSYIPSKAGEAANTFITNIPIFPVVALFATECIRGIRAYSSTVVNMHVHTGEHIGKLLGIITTNDRFVCAWLTAPRRWVQHQVTGETRWKELSNTKYQQRYSPAYERRIGGSLRFPHAYSRSRQLSTVDASLVTHRNDTHLCTLHHWVADLERAKLVATRLEGREYPRAYY